MDWDRRRFDDRRGGESYRPGDRSGRSPPRGYDGRHRRSPPRNRSPRPRADTWVPPSNRGYGRPRSRSPPTYRRRSRTPPFQGRGFGSGIYGRKRTPPRRFSPRRDERIRSPPPPSRRSKSPYSEGRSRDVSRGRTSPPRTRDATPGSQEYRAPRRDILTASGNDKHGSALSPRAQPKSSLRSQSPPHAARRDYSSQNPNKDRSQSSSRHASPAHAMEIGLGAASRRSSPGVHAERVDRARRTRSRSPFHESSSFQRRSRPPGRSPTRDSKFEREPSFADHVPENPAQTSFSPPPLPPAADKAQLDQYHLSGNRTGNGIPTQPRNHSASPLPPSGPHQGPRSTTVQNRGSHNLSMLSAPTRPRRGPGSRENPWGGTPPRRGPVTPASHPPPSGPRANFTPPGPGGGNYRHPSSRQNSVPFIAQSSAPRFTNHLAGLCSIIPGGRVLPSALDPAVEKRLSQLEADQEKLHEQMTGTQKSKRAELRDWDKLDRESSISALKSELAEGHLQRMADESIGGGIPF